MAQSADGGSGVTVIAAYLHIGSSRIVTHFLENRPRLSQVANNSSGLKICRRQSATGFR
jgi:hypothetical protein